SAGGHLTAMLATLGTGDLDRDARIRVGAAWSPPVDLTALARSRGDDWAARLMGCTPATCPDRLAQASPVTHVDGSDAPLYLVNSTEELVPLSQAQAMADRLRLAGVDHRLDVLPGTRHALDFREDAWAPTLAFLEEHLGEADEGGSSRHRSARCRGGGRAGGRRHPAGPQQAAAYHRPVTEPWEQRFRAASVSFPHWARHAPDRLVFSSNESGAWQIYAWDRTSGLRRQVTDHPIGVVGGAATPHGDGVVWFHDVTGDEVGHWLVAPFEQGDPRPLAPGVPDAWTTGLALGENLVVAGTAADDGYSVFVVEGDAPVRLIHHHPQPVDVAGLSRDSSLLALAHAEHGDTIHPALRVVDARTGAGRGDQWDGPGLGLGVAGWSPVAGDQRVALSHEREGMPRPAVWDLSTGRRRDYPIDLPGDVEVEGWWPDASALLLVHQHEGRDELFRLDLDGGDITRLDHPPGTISGAGVRPDGEVWFRLASGAEPPTIRTLADGDQVLAPPGDRPPAGRPYCPGRSRTPTASGSTGSWPPRPGTAPTRW
ncbi:MAG: prolyl oligopeptidase family serine peptidase, partial [Acidimicrobiales bacterium]